MKRARILLLGLISLTIAACTGGEGDTKEVAFELPTDWVMHQQDSFAVPSPSSWEMDYSGRMGTSFILFSPEDSLHDYFRENVNLVQEYVTGQSVTLDGYVEQAVNILKDYMNDLEDLEVVMEGDSYWLSYKGIQGAMKLKMKQRVMLRNEVVYILTYTALIDRKSDHDEAADLILEQFTLGKP
jgi:hypothetical protein